MGEWTRTAFINLDKRGLGNEVCVHAFEPAPAYNEKLRNRLAADIRRARTHVHGQALGDSPKVSRFTVTGGGTSALSDGASVPGDEIDVEVSTLDEVAARFSMNEIVLIKIDTEGNDFNVIRGAAQLLGSGRVMVVQFEYNWRWVGFGHWLRSVFLAIENTNYALGRLTQDRIEIHDDWHPALEQYFETNYVLVRRDVLPFLPHQRLVFSNSETVKPL